MTVYFAANLVERQQFGLCQITVEGIDAALGRQSKAGCYLRRFRFFLRASGFHFFIERDSLGRIFAGSAVAFVLVGGVPINE